MLLVSKGSWMSLVLIVLISIAIDFDWYGQTPNNISYKTTPNDQISAFVV